MSRAVSRSIWDAIIEDLVSCLTPASEKLGWTTPLGGGVFDLLQAW